MPLRRLSGSCSLIQTVRAPSVLLLDEDIGRHEGAGAVVLRPVELDAAGDPRPGEADERRLDHVLAVEEIVVVVRLVLADEDASADFRQHHQPDELVFQPRGLIGHIGCGSSNTLSMNGTG